MTSYLLSTSRLSFGGDFMGLAVMGSEGSEWGPGPTLLCARTLYSYCRGSIQRNIKSLFNKGSMHTRSILYVGHHQIFLLSHHYTQIYIYKTC